MIEHQYISVRELARQKGVSRSAIYYALMREEFPHAERFGDRWMIPIGEASQYTPRNYRDRKK